MIPIIATNQKRPKNTVALVQWITIIVEIIILMKVWVSNSVFMVVLIHYQISDKELLP